MHQPRRESGRSIRYPSQYQSSRLYLDFTEFTVGKAICQRSSVSRSTRLGPLLTQLIFFPFLHFVSFYVLSATNLNKDDFEKAKNYTKKVTTVEEVDVAPLYVTEDPMFSWNTLQKYVSRLILIAAMFCVA